MTRAKKITLFGTLFVLLAGTALYFALIKKSSDVAKDRAITIKKGDLSITILATGTVQAENRVEVKPPINGRIEEIFVEEGAQVKKNTRLALMSSTERAALLDAALAKGQAELKQWEKLYPPTPILAPITGTIIQRNVETGQSFTSQDATFVMSDRLTVKAQVDETDIAQIKLKQSAKITLDAYSNQSLNATVDQIAFDAKTVNNVTTYVVDVLPENAPDFMRSGMTANVSFGIDSRKDVVLLPADALRYHKDRKFVKIKVNEEVSEKEIETGLTDGKFFEVTSGLSEGDIVLAPNFKSEGKGNKGGSPFSPNTGRSRTRS